MNQPQITGIRVVDAILLASIALQTVSLGLAPSIIAAINSVALLGIAGISVWQAAKAANRDRVLASVKKTAEATHTLSNSAMGAQLKLNAQFAVAAAVMAHRIALLTNTDGDIASAAAADVQVKQQQELLQAHLIKQAGVDAKS